MAECQTAAQEGLNTLRASVELAQAKITVQDYDQQWRGVYLPADSACLAFLGTNPPVEVSGNVYAQDAACEDAGHYAWEGSYHLIGAIVSKTQKEGNQQKMDGLSAIRQAANGWKMCFPGESIPPDLQLDPFGR